MTTETATVETFWDSVIGHSTPSSIVDEYDMWDQTEKQIGEWLDLAWEAARGEGYNQIVPLSVWTEARDALFTAASSAE